MRTLVQEWAYYGLRCAVYRIGDPSLKTGKSYLCGYVYLPEGHPWEGLPAESIPCQGVHGGINYSDTIDDEEGDWAVGFDTMHAGDCVGKTLVSKWSLESVQAEVERLALYVMGTATRESVLM